MSITATGFVNMLGEWGDIAVGNARFAFSAVPGFDAAYRLWENKPNIASVVALGSNGLSLAANKSGYTALALGALQPFALHKIAQSEARARASDAAAKRNILNQTRNFISGNPITSALLAGVTAIASARYAVGGSTTNELSEDKK